MKKWELINSAKVKLEPKNQDQIIDRLLANRDIKTKKEKDIYLNPDIKTITLESVGIDIKQTQKALKRIKKALDKNEKIIVFGDYDVDGITSCAIIWETINELKGNVMPYIPSRMEEGYGLSIIGIENLLKLHPETKVIITVDNGIVANEAVAFANSKGIDVIITDHHVLSSKDKNPKAFAIIHTTSLCGAGIAWLFAREIKLYVGKIEYNFKDDLHLELACLGTVADLVPLKNANRIIVKFGIEKLSQSKRLGLKALFEESGCDASTIGVYQIGHIIAPRLNAAGRIENAMDSLRLLCTKDKKRAVELAHKLGLINRERQIIMRNAFEHAFEKVKNNNLTNETKKTNKILIVDDSSYQEGIIGLVAGKLVDEFYLPSIVISKKEKISKGSVRSIAGFDIIDFLRKNNQDLFINVGGHPMAAGFTIETDKIVLLKNLFEIKASENITDDLLLRSVKIDCLISFDLIDENLYSKIQKLKPFGMGNFEPIFQTNEVVVKDYKILGKEGNHLKILVENKGFNFECIAFGIGDKINELSINEVISIAYSIDENNWNNNKKLQLKIKDFKKFKN